MMLFYFGWLNAAHSLPWLPPKRYYYCNKCGVFAALQCNAKWDERERTHTQTRTNEWKVEKKNERKSSPLLCVLLLFYTALSTSSRFIWWAVERYEDI